MAHAASGFVAFEREVTMDAALIAAIGRRIVAHEGCERPVKIIVVPDGLSRLGRSRHASLTQDSCAASRRGFTMYKRIARGAFAKVAPLGGDCVA